MGKSKTPQKKKPSARTKPAAKKRDAKLIVRVRPAEKENYEWAADQHDEFDLSKWVRVTLNAEVARMKNNSVVDNAG